MPSIAIHVVDGFVSSPSPAHFDPLVLQKYIGTYLYDQLLQVPSVRIYGPPPGPNGDGRAALCSFSVKGVHATDLSTFLDQQHGCAIRSGHHCTQPLHRHLGVSATARASLYFYNTTEDVDRFIVGLKDTIDFFQSMAS